MVENIEYIQAKTSSHIARELNISRQAVSQTLKRTIIKVYKGLQENKITTNPTETIMFMRDWFGIEDDDDIQQFYDLFPQDIRDDIKAHARNYPTGEF
ncbi:MAG: hypothetical protein KQ78_01495 [Candidatus Izimaplasma bacterium HR2]|nr:MAG: hypothetical protein KQ78_01495 [Candidatus Izimaplasma bacterium HR2]